MHLSILVVKLQGDASPPEKKIGDTMPLAKFHIDPWPNSIPPFPPVQYTIPSSIHYVLHSSSFAASSFHWLVSLLYSSVPFSHFLIPLTSLASLYSGIRGKASDGDPDITPGKFVKFNTFLCHSGAFWPQTMQLSVVYFRLNLSVFLPALTESSQSNTLLCFYYVA